MNAFIKRALMLASVLLALVACAPQEAIVVVAGECGAFALAPEVACQRVSEEVTLLQASKSATIAYANAVITLDGLLFARESATSTRFIALQGLTVISVNNSTRQLTPGTQLTLALTNGQIIGMPQAPEPYDEVEILLLTQTAPSFTPVPVLNVPRTPDVLPTQQPANTATPATCQPREEWTSTYTVQRGDVLTRIANRYGTTLDELVRANCLSNPNRIRIGDVLRVPTVSATLAPANAPTLTPSAVAFRADRSVIAQGECTTLRWDVFNVQAVTLDGEPTQSNSQQNVCPTQTTTYTLRVTYPNGTESTHSVTVAINP
jgi:LysM repeat protein